MSVAQAVAAVFLAGYAVALVVDLRERRIPNAVTYPLLALGLVARPDGIGLAPVANVVAALVTFGLFALFAFRGWMGMGDAKLAAVVALAAGPVVAVVALWLAFALGAVVGLALVAARRLSRRQAIPFGPFLALAGIVAVLAPAWLLRVSPFAGLFT